MHKGLRQMKGLWSRIFSPHLVLAEASHSLEATCSPAVLPRRTLFTEAWKQGWDLSLSFPGTLVLLMQVIARMWRKDGVVIWLEEVFVLL
jgi:hypothetical protein